MGLHIGVVKIDYLSRPSEPAYGFLKYLAINVRVAEWRGGWQGNSIFELTRRRMLALGRLYGKQNGLSQDKRKRLTEWINELPWDDETIMLHLNW